MEHLLRCRISVGEPGGGLLFGGDFERYVNGAGEQTSALVLARV
jgi:hypothetical protein